MYLREEKLVPPFRKRQVTLGRASLLFKVILSIGAPSSLSLRPPHSRELIHRYSKSKGVVWYEDHCQNGSTKGLSGEEDIHPQRLIRDTYYEM